MIVNFYGRLVESSNFAGTMAFGTDMSHFISGQTVLGTVNILPIPGCLWYELGNTSSWNHSLSEIALYTLLNLLGLCIFL